MRTHLAALAMGVTIAMGAGLPVAAQSGLPAAGQPRAGPGGNHGFQPSLPQGHQRRGHRDAQQSDDRGPHRDLLRPGAARRQGGQRRGQRPRVQAIRHRQPGRRWRPSWTATWPISAEHSPSKRRHGPAVTRRRAAKLPAHLSASAERRMADDPRHVQQRTREV